MNDPSGLVSALRAEVGDDLRVVAEYTDEGYDIHYVRDDIERRIEALDTDRIHQELILQGIGKEHLETLFDGGRLQCSVHRFDELTACHFVETESAGSYVSIESDATLQFRSFVQTCKQYM